MLISYGRRTTEPEIVENRFDKGDFWSSDQTVMNRMTGLSMKSLPELQNLISSSDSRTAR